jgi:hypothetical protein
VLFATFRDLFAFFLQTEAHDVEDGEAGDGGAWVWSL